MKPLPRPSARFYRQCLSLIHRAYTSPPPSNATLSALTARPPKHIYDYLTPMSSHLLTTTLSDLLSAPQTSDPAIQFHPELLPQGHHLVYFPLQTPPSRLAADGADLDHSPGEPFVRRVWAGGEVRFGRSGLRLGGEAAVCREVVGGASVRGEGEGIKVFVDVVRKYGRGHEVERERERWDVKEVRTLVFMPPKKTGDESQPKIIKIPYNPSKKVTVTPTPHHLFHFSALSFNAHLIHIDPTFALADGHPAPLVHGPLTLALMLRVLADEIGPKKHVQRFTYRNFAPLYVNQEMSICVREVKDRIMEVWVEGPGGGLAVRGRAMIMGDYEGEVYSDYHLDDPYNDLAIGFHSGHSDHGDLGDDSGNM